MQFHFSDHVLDVNLRELTRGGENVAVEPQVFDLLTYLVNDDPARVDAFNKMRQLSPAARAATII